jgi:hypothetical protein
MLGELLTRRRFSTTHKKQLLGCQFFAHDAEIANAATTIAAPTVTGCGVAFPCDAK